MDYIFFFTTMQLYKTGREYKIPFSFVSYEKAFDFIKQPLKVPFYLNVSYPYIKII